MLSGQHDNVLHQLFIPRQRLFLAFGLLFIVSMIIAIITEEKLFYILPFVILLPIFIEHPRYVYLLLIATLPLSTEIQVTNSLGTDLPDEFLMISMTGLLFFLFVFKKGLLSHEFGRHPLLFLLTIHLLWIAVTCVFSAQPILSLKYLLAKTWYVIPFVFCTVLFANRRSLLHLALLLLIPMSFVVIQSLIRHAAFGFSFADVSKTVIPFFRNHVNYSAMLVCLIPLLFAILHHTKKAKYRRVVKAGILIFMLGLFFSYSRGAWLALIIGAFVYYAISKKMIEIVFLVTAFFIVGSFTFLATKNRYIDYRPDFNKTIFHTDFAQHMTATYRFRDLSTAERFYRWIAAIRMSGDHLITGVGPNNFYTNYKPYTVSAYKTWVSNNKDHSTVHNYFLLVLCEQGIPGLLFFTALLFGTFYYAQKIYHRSHDPLIKTASITIGSILGIITTVNFVSDLIETDKIGSLFFICIGLLIRMDTRRMNNNIVSNSNSSPNIQRIP